MEEGVKEHAKKGGLEKEMEGWMDGGEEGENASVAPLDS